LICFISWVGGLVVAESVAQAEKLVVFISYSRDDLTFSDQLVTTLEFAGFDARIDRRGIHGAENWQEKLGTLIREADTVVFVLSPSSAVSKICAREVEQAVALGKRIIPVVCRPLDGAAAPPALAALNYIFFYDEPEKPGTSWRAGMLELEKALRTDMGWLREQTRLQQRAIEWDQGGRSPARLIASQQDIQTAKVWSIRRPKGAPPPTELALAFIAASEAWADQQERERLVKAPRSRTTNQPLEMRDLLSLSTHYVPNVSGAHDERLKAAPPGRANRRFVIRGALVVVLGAAAGAGYSIARQREASLKEALGEQRRELEKVRRQQQELEELRRREQEQVRQQRQELEELRQELKELRQGKRGAVPPPVVPVARAEDSVDCSVFSPPAAPPGTTILVQVFLHLPEQARRAKAQASTMDDSTTHRGVASLRVAITRGAHVTVSLSASGLGIDEPQQSITWRGDPAFAQFLLTFPSDSDGRAFHCVARLSVDGGLAGCIKFRQRSDKDATGTRSASVDGSSNQYRYAFLSYASADRSEVLKRAQALHAARVSFFQDVLSLRAGANWENEIYKHIDKCDLFLLFWSRAAKESEWVIREAEYALSRRTWSDEPDVVPVILEGPDVVLPPDSLKSIHFNDTIHYLIPA
jgi:hypothetical protein